MKKSYAGMQYWLLCTGLWMIIILIVDLEFPLLTLVVYSIIAGYITALIIYNLKDHFRYIFRKNFSSTRKIAPSRIKKPKFRFRMLPDMSGRD